MDYHVVFRIHSIEAVWVEVAKEYTYIHTN